MPGAAGNQPDNTTDDPSNFDARTFQLDLAAVAQIRADLWRHGFRPVALYNHDTAWLPLTSRGKRPVGDDWQLLAAQDPPAVTQQRPNPAARNTGCLTAGLRALDVDVDDPRIADQLVERAERRLGRTILRLRENCGRVLLLYRAASGTPPKLVHVGADTTSKIEVLGVGQQFAAHGLHYTGVPLAWPYGAPWDTALGDLPAVSEEQLTQFRGDCAELIGEYVAAPRPDPGYRPLVQRTHLPGDHDLTIADIEAALAVISGQDDYDTWVAIGMAVYVASTGDLNGYEAWRSWSSWSAKYSTRACETKWHHFGRHPPNRTGPQKLIALARQAQPDFVTPSLAARLADPDRALRERLRQLAAHRPASTTPDPRIKSGGDLPEIAMRALDRAMACPVKSRRMRLFHDHLYNSNLVTGRMLDRYQRTRDLPAIAEAIAAHAVANKYNVDFDEFLAILQEIVDLNWT